MSVKKGVAPTKANLIKLKDDLKFGKLGYELLDQKKFILVNELLNLIDQAEALQDKVFSALDNGYGLLEEAVMDMGKLKTHNIASGINIQSGMNIKNRRLMGVILPVIDSTFEDHDPYFSPRGSSPKIDATIVGFKNALQLMGELAELKISIMRLAGEVKKTIRKVNALEKIVIPELGDTLKFVEHRLEEHEREAFVLMKMVKKRLEKGLN